MSRRRPTIYFIQNAVIHRARAQLGISLDDVRVIAGLLNLGVQSISRLTLTQREALIDRLISLGATVRNPHANDYDLVADEQARSGKVARFPVPTPKQNRALAILAEKVKWHTEDGYLRFCFKLLKAPSPRNHREVTKIRLALMSLIAQQGRKRPSPSVPLPRAGEGRAAAQGEGHPKDDDDGPAAA